MPEPQPSSGPIGTWSWERLKRFARFGLVGASGFFVNEIALALIVSTFGVNYLLGAVAATQVSTLWNFSLVELWAFRDLDAKRSPAQRLVFFLMVNNAALLLRGPILIALTSGLGLNYLVSNLVSLGVLTLVRFAVADNWIWAVSEQRDFVRDRDRLATGAEQDDDDWPPHPGEAAIASVPGLALMESSGYGLTDSDFGAFSAPAVLAVVEPPAGVSVPAPEPAARLARWVWPAAIAVVAVVVRVWNLDGTGFNSDEVVYSSQAALLAGKSDYGELFTLFRAHPLLFQGLLSLVYRVSMSDYLARLLSVGFGVGTVAVGFWAGRSLYGRRVGLIAAAILAVMPYGVVVSRQVLLDGAMVFFATLALGLVARFVDTREPRWLYVASVALGLTFLTKETGILMAVAMYAFLVLTPQLRVRVRQIIASLAILAGFVVVFPLAVALGKRSNTGEQFFIWQVLRRPNHGFMYYLDHTPQALGLGVVVLALLGLCFLRRDRTWRETLLLCWVVVPTVFFVLWPVKGFQYLLPIAPAVAILASRPLALLPTTGRLHLRRLRLPVVVVTGLVGAALAVSLLVPTWFAIRPSDATVVDAGAGGLPRGREAGTWIGHTAPIGAKVITIGPSMSNLVRYFGERESFGLSVSTNPLHRNPVYEPVGNADLRLRRGEIQYLVWDSTSASRAPSFASQLVNLAHRFHGRVVHRERVGGRDAIVVYQVRP